MKRLFLSACLLALTSLPATAQNWDTQNWHGNDANGPSAHIGVNSDNRKRGISHSDEGFSAQGGFSYQHETGPYAGIDASTVDLRLDDDTNVEAILFGGLKGDYAGIDVKGEISYTSYLGADNNDLDFWELALSAGYDFDVFYGEMGWHVSPDYINESGLTFYYSGDIEAALPIMNIDLFTRAHLGFLFVDDKGRYVSDDVIDWSLGLFYNISEYDVDLGLSYVDTDLDDNECVERCGARAVVSATKNFGW